MSLPIVDNGRELFAVKLIERGEKIDEHVQREIMNHRSLKHPNIVRFKEVLLTPTHLAIVIEYATGGELYMTFEGFAYIAIGKEIIHIIHGVYMTFESSPSNFHSI